MSKLPIVYMSRKEHFSAGHTLHSKKLSPEQNKTTFGKCTAIHGHNYNVKATVRGPIDPVTGMCMDMDMFKKALQSVLNKLDHKFFDNDIEFFQNLPSTNENVCVFIWNELQKLLPENVVLYEIKVNETNKNGVYYRGEKQ